MGDPPQSRRARLREATSQEIKAVALKHMAANGTASISLRAIARDMGMTAGAIYSYYDNRDVLISALCADVYAALDGRLKAARDKLPETDAAGRIRAHGLEYREWAVTRPEEFRLLYGDPVPDYIPPTTGPAAEAERSLCGALLDLVADAWPHASARVVIGEYEWSDFDENFVQKARDDGLTPDVVALSLRVWGRMHGLVALEVYDHLTPHVMDPKKLYRTEMRELTSTLGLDRGAE
jgi:AcrR family transcriptional regulator